MMNRTSKKFDCVIIGAGIAGLLGARVLADRGHRVCVLEKGRGFGGRMATRRRDGAVFDHGAQFITARDKRFQRWVEQWLALGIVAPWYEFADSGVRYRGVPGMTAIPKHLADGLDVRREVIVQNASRTDGNWEVRSNNGEKIAASALLLTAPVPQSLDLLDAGAFAPPDGDLAKLRAIQFHRCIAALAILDRPSSLAAHGGSIKLQGEPVQWIADNQRKGVSPDVPAVTIHSTPAFAEKHWDVDDSLRLPKLLEAAAPHLQADVVSCQGHRWGFSAPVASFDREAFVDAGRRLAIAGDGLNGGRVEGAALSGLAAAEALAGALQPSR